MRDIVSDRLLILQIPRFSTIPKGGVLNMPTTSSVERYKVSKRVFLVLHLTASGGEAPILDVWEMCNHYLVARL